MPLKLQLKQDEKVVVNGAVIQSRPRGRGCDLWVMNEAQVLRGRQIMREADATTTERQLYFAIQVMYLFPGDDVLARESYPLLYKDIASRRPDLAQALQEIDGHVQQSELYLALKRCGRMVNALESSADTAVEGETP